MDGVPAAWGGSVWARGPMEGLEGTVLTRSEGTPGPGGERLTYSWRKPRRIPPPPHPALPLRSLHLRVAPCYASSYPGSPATLPRSSRVDSTLAVHPASKKKGQRDASTRRVLVVTLCSGSRSRKISTVAGLFWQRGCVLHQFAVY
jgi:hypothetical protein